MSRIHPIPPQKRYVEGNVTKSYEQKRMLPSSGVLVWYGARHKPQFGPSFVSRFLLEKFFGNYVLFILCHRERERGDLDL